MLEEPDGDSRHIVFVYAPGAGANIHDPFGRHAAQRLNEQGLAVLRMQFPYMEEKRKSPDRTAVLAATWQAVIERARKLGPKLVVGGRSMGGRIATHVVAEGVPVDGVALFAYPLHSPAKPGQWRDSHLSSIDCPTLFCSGTRDAFATPEELKTVAAKMKRATVHLLESADHGFAVSAASGRTRQQVWDEAIQAMLGWMKRARIT
jgi:predicted alpha/beta-hydrolase family hydrolase